MNRPKRIFLSLLCGLALLVCNERVLERLTRDHRMDSPVARLALAGVDAGLVAAAICFLRFPQVPLALGAWLRRHRRPLVALGLGTGLTLWAGDMMLAYRTFAHSDDGFTSYGRLHEPDEQLGWKPMPGAVARNASEGSYAATYRIDDEGFRRTQRQAAPDFSIYFFGDSFTFGLGVEDEQTFVSVIGASILDGRVNVYNAGAMGYGMTQMYGRMLQLLDRVKPRDMIVFTVLSGDIERNLDGYVFPYQFLLRKKPADMPHSTYPVFRGGSIQAVRLEDTLLNRGKLLLLTGPVMGQVVSRIRGLFHLRPQLEAKQIAEAARGQAEARQARFALMFIPRVTEAQNRQHDIDVSGLGGIDLLDYFPCARAELAPFQLPRDLHYSPAGHAYAARVIIAGLVHEGLLDEAYVQDRTSLELRPRGGCSVAVPG